MAGTDERKPDQRLALQEEKRTLKETSGTDMDMDNTKTGKLQGETAKTKDFPVVCIGASAGGLEAIEAFLSGLPEKSGIAFVIVTHTHPDHTTRLPEILRRKSPVEVVLLEDGTRLKPDTLFIPPSDKDPVIKDGGIRLQERTSRADAHLPIDRFLKSLADEYGEAAGCVILSGSGTDGTGGLRRIKENGGVAFAQSKRSAQHRGMPESAIETGLIDFVLDPPEMAKELIAYFKHPNVLRAEAPEKSKHPDVLSQILTFLANHTGHDFSGYKKNTLFRRINRRMGLNHCPTMEDYLNFLQRNPRESHALFQDMLISVTSFFRDPEVFAFLQNQMQEFFTPEADGDSFRVWIPGCATGEEAYSVAIIIIECMENLNITRQLQIFATDVDENAIEKAWRGLYTSNIATDVSAERLKRFFTKEGNQYRVKKELREPIVFANQDVLRDPPFIHLDMLVCRNLLIYLEIKAQSKLLLLFHYSLKSSGILFLGTSESTGRFSELFHPLNKKFGIYQKLDEKRTTGRQVHFLPGKGKVPHAGPVQKIGIPDWEKDTTPDGQLPKIGLVVKRILLERHTPACALVDDRGEIVYIHGRTGKYLEHAPGKPSLRIVECAREGLRNILSDCLGRAVRKKEVVQRTGVRVKANGDSVTVDLTIKPIDEPGLNTHYMVLFEESPEFAGGETPSMPADAAEDGVTPDDAATERIAELERELNELRSDYHSSQEELESSNEELKSVNEEMYSSNEELQSTNEELESSREELEALNEELSTVNNELNEKITELNESYGKLTDVLNSADMAIIFLDNDLVVRRFTDQAARLVNLIDQDMGRPLSHISHFIENIDLTHEAARVIKSLTPFETEVRTKDGHWYRMHIMVNRAKHVIEGVVLTFINIDPQKIAQAELQAYAENEASAARRLTESIVDTVRESLLVLDGNLRVVSANRRFHETFATPAGKVEDTHLFEIGDGQFDIPELRRLLEEIIPRNEIFEDYLVEHSFERTGVMRMHLNARRLRGKSEDEERILLAILAETE
jgi:two-component system, chemotaxis family, CheB/CheR fusion protein